MTGGTVDRARPRSLALLIAAGVLAAAVVVLVLLFGVARPPALAPLAAEPTPAPSAAVAWSAYEQDDGECLHVARPDAEVVRVACEVTGGMLVAWDDDGIVVPRWGPSDELVWIDPVTGDEVRRDRVADGHDVDPHAQNVVTSRHRDGVLTVTRQDTGEVVWEVEAPDTYRVDNGTVSPDGAWIALVDSASRLLVLPQDGSVAPRVWAEDVPAWTVPLWEGTPHGRVSDGG
jgi:hypothetical protein